MIRVGNREVIFHETILSDNIDQEIWVTTTHEGEDVRLCLVFEETPLLGVTMNPPPTPNPAEAAVTIEARADHARVVIRDWNRFSGAMTPIMQLGRMNNGRGLFLIFECTRVASMAKLTVQIMIEGAA